MLKYMGFMPLAIIAAQVVITAIRMINVKTIESFYEKDKRDFYNALLVGFLCCLKDPITAIGLGLFYYCIEFCHEIRNAWAEIVFKEQTTGLSRLNSMMKSFRISK